MMMKKNKLLEICISNRTRSLEHTKTNWFKKYSIDLIIKMYFLLINSLGKKSFLDHNTCLFFDEVKNSSMINNLRKTRCFFKENEINSYFLCFYKIDRSEHIKIGYLKGIFLIFKFTFFLVCVFLRCLFKKDNITEQSMSLLMNIYLQYLKSLSDYRMRAYLMTDHHFYSTVTTAGFCGTSIVLQHGLIMDKRFYYPIYADYFLAWGERSKKLLENDKKVFVTGTYKFQFDHASEAKKRINRTMLFCISSLDNNVVKEKIDCLLEISLKLEITLAVKCHPGSQFNVEHWKNIYSDTNIIFYQEELLENLFFDLAITENSTIIMDLLALKKPFILYDSMDGYFNEYADIIPQGNTKEEIQQCIKHISDFGFEKINETLCRLELNNSDCKILEFNLDHSH